MDNISISPEQLKIQAKVYLDARQQIEDARDKVSRMNGEIGTQWKGKAFESYMNQFEQLSKHVNEFTTLLGEIFQQLDKYADTTVMRDSEDARGFGLM